ncbi:hypothetical protein HYV44_03170 [Candidatus Microgenomates bacterium]|nr:hypothetical protein [Candidatus Microgenomates bacterium]
MKKIVLFSIGILLASASLFVVPAQAYISGYAYEFVDQSVYPTNLNPNETTNVWIEIKNIGTATWRNSGDYPIRLGAGSEYGNENQQRDYSSEFYDSATWLSANRPTAILHPEIRPGWHTRFQFNIKAPSNNGTYKAYFTPVVDGKAWMKDIGIFWQLTVGSTDNSDTNNTNNQNTNNTNQSGANITVTSLTLSPTAPLTIRTGDTYNYTLTAIYSDGSQQDVTSIAVWDVSYDTGTGNVYPAGRFIAGSMGTCWVTATFGGKSIKSALITIAGL